jgi:glycine cleavage system H protein
MPRYYTDEHEWIDVEDDIATVGITEYAQGQLGDIVFVELPEVGAMIEQGKDAAVVESVKAASDVYAPITGEVTEVNPALEEDPALVNSSPEDDGWFFRMTIAAEAELDALMDEDAYKAFVENL